MISQHLLERVSLIRMSVSLIRMSVSLICGPITAFDASKSSKILKRGLTQFLLFAR